MKQDIPNLITTARIIGAVCLMFFQASTQWLSCFWLLYAFCGITDIVDGYVARRFNAETKIGALLDSIADIIFVACIAYKLFPLLKLSSWMWIWVIVIVGIKTANQISALAVYGKPMFPHNLANKLTGLMLFICIPLFVCFGWDCPIIIAAVFATFAAVQEGHNIRTRKEYD